MTGVILFCLSGALFELAALIACIDGRTDTGVMDVAVGAMMFVVGLLNWSLRR